MKSSNIAFGLKGDNPKSIWTILFLDDLKWYLVYHKQLYNLKAMAGLKQWNAHILRDKNAEDLTQKWRGEE
jgi:hypothetical protein